MIVATIGVALALIALNEAMLPVPFAAKPIDGVLLVQLYTVPATAPLKFTTAVGAPLHTAWLETGFTVGTGLIVILNEQLAVFAEASVAVKVITVVPTGNTEPDAGPPVCVTTVPGQLSEETGVEKLTTWLPHNTILAGQVITGACVSFTVIVNEQVGPAELETFTVVVPLGKKEPEAGVAVMVPQVPDVVGAG